jgi:hypothetical protein
MRKKIFSRALLIVGLAIVMCSFSLQASAMTFTYTEQAGFVLPGMTSSDNVVQSPISKGDGNNANDINWYNAAGPVAPVAGEFNTIAWGVTNNTAQNLGSNPFGNSSYSGLQILGQTGLVVADNGWVTLAKIYHQNNIIPEYIKALATGTINGTLNLTPTTSGFPNTDNANITFKETLNAGSCGAGSPPSTNGCPDFFTVNAGTFQPVFFKNGLTRYRADFDLLPVSVAKIDQLDPETIRIWTLEGQLSELDVVMRITTVPEPATLTLLGLGLLGLGFIKRRKN